MSSGSLTVWLHRLAPAAAVALLLGAGVVHRSQTETLRNPEILSAAADRLDAVPIEFDGWVAEPLDLSERQLRLAEATGGFARRYVGPNGEGPIEVMLLTGPQGPISVHPPTVCFRGAGYRQCSPVATLSTDEITGADSFAAATFEKSIDGRPVQIRTHWAWGVGTGWSAPETPRVAFAGEPFLYKLYVTEFRSQDAADSEGGDAPLPATRAFLDAFLPRLKSVLVADPAA